MLKGFLRSTEVLIFFPEKFDHCFWRSKHDLITRAQPKAGTGHKMQTVSFFKRYIARDIPLT